MTTTLERPASRTVRGHWIDDWRPEDRTFWDTTGAPSPGAT